jgi:hypothetical protein
MLWYISRCGLFWLIPINIQTFKLCDNIIENAVAQHHAVKFFVTCDIEFFRHSETGDRQTTLAGFRTSATTDSYYYPSDIVDDLKNQILNFNQRGRNWIIASHDCSLFAACACPVILKHQSFLSTRNGAQTSTRWKARPTDGLFK